MKQYLDLLLQVVYNKIFGWPLKAAILPSGRNNPLVLYPCNHTLYEWVWIEWKVLDRLLLLLIIWTSTVA